MFSTTRQQIFLVFFGTLLAVFSLVSIVLFTDPENAGWLTLTSLYTSAFLVSLGLFTLLGLLIRRFLKQKLFMLNLNNSFRQAMIVSTLVICSLVLQSFGLLYWWVALSLIIFFLCLEAFLNLGT